MDNCPKCKVSFIGDPIPLFQREHYSPPYNWRREIGIEVPSIYDGCCAYRCPDCGHEFPRSEDLWAKELFKRYKKLRK